MQRKLLGFASLWILLGNAAFGADFGNTAVGAEFDAKTFEERVNEALSDMPGVTFEVSEEEADVDAIIEQFKSSPPDMAMDWANFSVENAPNFGFVVSNEKGMPVDVLSGDAPFKVVGDDVNIPGYNLPEGYDIKTVGTAGYVEAIGEMKSAVEAPSNDIKKAVNTVRGASAYIQQELCSAIGRPTEISLNLTAGFTLAFNLETGSQITWDLEVVCLR